MALGTSWGLSGPLGGSCFALGSLLVALGVLLGRSVVHLGSSWGTIGCFVVPLGPSWCSWAALGAFLGASGALLGALGGSWFWMLLGVLGSPLGSIREERDRYSRPCTCFVKLKPALSVSQLLRFGGAGGGL